VKFRAHGEGNRNSVSNTYEGSFENGKFHGRGTIKFANGDELTGASEQGHLVEGVMKTDKGEFRGEFDKNYKLHGEGYLKLQNGKFYMGNWVHGTKHGDFDVLDEFGSHKAEFKNDQIFNGMDHLLFNTTTGVSFKGTISQGVPSTIPPTRFNQKKKTTPGYIP